MKLIGRNKLFEIYSENGADTTVQHWICSWVSEIQHANWKSLQEVKDYYPNSTYANGVFVFHINNSNKQIHLFINFLLNIAVITDIKEQL